MLRAGIKKKSTGRLGKCFLAQPGPSAHSVAITSGVVFSVEENQPCSTTFGSAPKKSHFIGVSGFFWVVLMLFGGAGAKLG